MYEDHDPEFALKMEAEFSSKILIKFYKVSYPRNGNFS
jgi:hypothetical protein